jgi:hypothetical protein
MPVVGAVGFGSLHAARCKFFLKHFAVQGSAVRRAAVENFVVPAIFVLRRKRRSASDARWRVLSSSSSPHRIGFPQL